MQTFKVICGSCGAAVEMTQKVEVFGTYPKSGVKIESKSIQQSSDKIDIFAYNDGCHGISCSCGNKVENS